MIETNTRATVIYYVRNALHLSFKCMPNSVQTRADLAYKNHRGLV